MCTVSMVTGHYGEFEPYPPNYPGGTTSPNIPFVPTPPLDWPAGAPATLPWTPESFALWKEILEKVKQLDTKLGLTDCEDPKKAEWMKSIEDRLKALEAK